MVEKIDHAFEGNEFEGTSGPSCGAREGRCGSKARTTLGVVSALAAVAGIAVGVQASTTPKDGASFRGLGSVANAPGVNANGCFLSDTGWLSADGSVALGISLQPGNFGTGAIAGSPVGVPVDGSSSAAFLDLADTTLYGPVALSADGSSAAGNNWIWDRATGLVNLSPVLEGDLFSIKTITDAALDAAGGPRLVGTTLEFFSGSGEPANVFVWDYAGGSPRIIPTPNVGQIGLSLFAQVSDDGSRIGSAVTFADFSTSPAIWDVATGAFELIGDLNPANRAGGVADLSADGSVVVGFSREDDFGVAGFRWTADGGIQSLADTAISRRFSPARAVSADGSVIVGQYLLTASITAPYIWTQDDGLRNLRDVLVNDYALASQLQGWTLVDVYDISAEGDTIIGYGINPQGCGELWVVDLDGADSAACASDTNADGQSDSGDLAQFIDAFLATDAAVADLTGDGQVDSGDLTAFITAFLAGC